MLVKNREDHHALSALSPIEKKVHAPELIGRTQDASWLSFAEELLSFLPFSPLKIQSLFFVNSLKLLKTDLNACSKKSLMHTSIPIIWMLLRKQTDLSYEAWVIFDDGLIMDRLSVHPDDFTSAPLA